MRLPTNKKTAFWGVLLAFSLILGYIESLFSFPFLVPGIKIGLSNLPVLLGLYLFGPGWALILSCVKAVLSALLFGNMNSFLYSFAGALLSALVMILMYKFRCFHIPTVSALGGVFHNIGQIITASFLLKTFSLIYYLPVLIISGLITGIMLGIITNLLIKPLKKFIYRGEIS